MLSVPVTDLIGHAKSIEGKARSYKYGNVRNAA